MSQSRHTRRWTQMAAALLLPPLGSCTVGPNYHPPAAPSLEAYRPPSGPTSATGPLLQHVDPSAPFPAEWWTLFRSPELDALVREALTRSPTLAQAIAKLEEAQEELNARTGATRYPAIAATVSAQEQQINLASYGIPFPNPRPFSLLNGSVAVSYALDVFGANRRLIEELREERDYELWQLAAARLMLAGNVVSASIHCAALRAEIDLTRQMIDARQEEVRIVEEQHLAGGASDYDVHSQRTAADQLRATLPPLEKQLDTVQDELAVLLGKSPAAGPIEPPSLERLKLPAELPLTLPSSLVHQRPDIRAAEALLHEASAAVGVATASLYPQIVLSASGGGIGKHVGDVGDVWNVGAALTQPIFQGGALRAEKRKAEASYREAAAVYRQTVLQAFEQVADALGAIEHDARTFETRAAAADEAAGEYEITARRAEAGGVSRVSLLESQRQSLQALFDRTAAESDRYTDAATLFQALGGGA